ncbi:hypothetical protein BRYFOR_05566 [Marvinbryantia formatexigens DSM 14469]|uniref:Uncharacterized protein n=1 Tax=Marvinbryantia formatexigens DSM 14469 TaxID=478749 RepID=C6LAC4_9FIRM|nr:hypothetical protein BRYFOR_05566 [Marvinbryantia formatexigens DSM 14469]
MYPAPFFCLISRYLISSAKRPPLHKPAHKMASDSLPDLSLHQPFISK